MASVVKSFALAGVDAYPVEVEIDLLGGLPAVSIVGLVDTAVREARERVQAALRFAGYHFPGEKVVINLAPGDIKKSGSHFDLAVAVGVLLRSGQLAANGEPDNFAFAAELSLNATLRPCPGVLPMAMAARAAGIQHFIVSRENLREASLVGGLHVYAFATLQGVISFLNGETPYAPPPEEEMPVEDEDWSSIDFKDVRGQDALLEYIVIAAAGGHNMLMLGSPGCGKSMVARRIPTILPQMSEDESLEVTKIYSVAGLLRERGRLIRSRPFRAPHHNASISALIGGGSEAGPGEISLAHNGVLFLDEIAEFGKKTLDALRQPMEDRCVNISRVKYSNSYPCSFMLVAAMNPCPCGYYGQERCRCSDYEVLKYRHKISGPILDRMDIQKYVQPVNFLDLSGHSGGTSSAALRERVEYAREQQRKRFTGLARVNCNAQMTAAQVKEYCSLEGEGRRLLERAYERFHYSARAFHKFLKVARTFADLDGSPHLRRQDVAAALMARDMDREQAGMLVI
ncbi:MAG: YifB family Mg chelatase-like AAA ATPase [Bacillota bacterium]